MTALLLFATCLAFPIRKTLTISDANITDILVGVVEGFFVGDDITKEQIKPCLASLNTTKRDVLDAVHQLSIHNSASMLLGLSYLGHALEEVPDALKKCDVAEEDVAKILNAVEQIKHIKSFVYIVGKHLFINGVDILRDIAASTYAFSKHDYPFFGEKVGEALRLLFLGFRLPTTRPLTLNINVTDVANGVTEGFGAKVTLLGSCVQGIDLSEILLAVSLIEAGNAHSVLRGITHLSNALDFMPQALKKCAASKKQIEAMSNALAVLASAEGFTFDAGKYLLINGAEIFDELVSACTYWHRKMPRQFGLEVGAALSKIVRGKKQVGFTEVGFTDLDAFNVVRGVTTGFFLGEVVIRQECITSVHLLVQDVSDAVALLGKETAADVLAALGLLAKSLTVVKDAMIQCQAEESRVAKMIDAIAALAHPANFSYIVARNLVINGSDIYHRLRAAIDDWESHDYYSFGMQVGLILNDIIVPSQHEVELIV